MWKRVYRDASTLTYLDIRHPLMQTVTDTSTHTRVMHSLVSLWLGYDEKVDERHHVGLVISFAFIFTYFAIFMRANVWRCVCVPGAERYLRTDDDGEVKSRASEQCTVYEYVYNKIDPKWMRNWKSCSIFLPLASSLLASHTRSLAISHQNVIFNDKYESFGFTFFSLALYLSVPLSGIAYHLSVTTKKREGKNDWSFVEIDEQAYAFAIDLRRLSVNAPFAPLNSVCHRRDKFNKTEIVWLFNERNENERRIRKKNGNSIELLLTFLHLRSHLFTCKWDESKSQWVYSIHHRMWITACNVILLWFVVKKERIQSNHFMQSITHSVWWISEYWFCRIISAHINHSKWWN